MFFSRFAMIAALLLPVAVGCGPSVESVPVQTKSAADDIKAGLQEIASSGQVSSSVEDLRTASGKLEDAAKKEALQKGLDELAGMSDPAKVKAKAQELINGL